MSAWGAGIATFAGDKILEVFYPDPQLDTPPGEPLAFDDVADDAARRRARAPS